MPKMLVPFRRWIRFYLVGAAGIAIQMGTLVMAVHVLDFQYLVATAFAVEAAVLHNFFWHTRWTWADRVVDCRLRLCSRLLCFNLTNGAVSLTVNLALTSLFVQKFGLSCTCANALSIAACSLLNFFAGDRVVFRRSRLR